MIVLSLFDGISCGMVALQKAGIKVERYYASEIDPYAISISKNRHPNIVHLGNVCDIQKYIFIPEKFVNRRVSLPRFIGGEKRQRRTKG